MSRYYPLLVLALPWFGAVCAALVGPDRRKTELVALASAVLTAVVLALGADGALRGEILFSAPWISELGVSFSLRLDALALAFGVNTILVSLLALLYAWGYMHHTEHRHVSYALLLAFLGSMLGTVLAADLLVFFIFWEAMLVSSTILVGAWGEGEGLSRITLTYFIYTQAGSLLILAGLARLVGLAGTSDMAAVATAAQRLPRGELTAIAGLLLAGFGVKMAIFPLHTWLPDAHSVAPMPVTIMLAAAMLSMGAYGILRLPMMMLGNAGLQEFQTPLLALALVSEVFGALMCLGSSDVKRLIAYSSVSQMGYILFGLATLTERGVSGAVLHVLTHGLVKAALFMGVGLVMEATQRRRLEDLGGLLRPMPAAMLGLAVGCLAIAGTPPFGPFHSDLLIFTGGLASGQTLAAYLQLFAPVLTAAYAVWFVLRLALGKAPEGFTLQAVPRTMQAAFYAALVSLTIVGVVPEPFYRMASLAASLVARGG